MLKTQICKNVLSIVPTYNCHHQQTSFESHLWREKLFVEKTTSLRNLKFSSITEVKNCERLKVNFFRLLGNNILKAYSPIWERKRYNFVLDRILTVLLFLC